MLRNASEVIKDFIGKYPHLECEAESIYSQARTAYLDLAFPFDTNLTDIPKDRPRAYQWVRDCMTEIVDRGGMSSVTAYRENGVSITFDSTWLSEGLKRRIIPKVGAPS